jgi:ATP-dependent RNA helicase DDX5/DBP2
MFRALRRSILGTSIAVARPKSSAATAKAVQSKGATITKVQVPLSSPLISVPEEPADEVKSSFSAAEYRKTHQIKLTGSNIDDHQHQPIVSFDATPFVPKLKQALLKQGYTAPTPTQAQSWPIALSGRDIISIARTGSGKTYGFLVPAIHKLLSSKAQVSEKSDRTRRSSSRRQNPRVLVVAPTRELAVQIEEETRKIGELCGVSSVVLYGGAGRGPQIKSLQVGADIVIGTPGRINDLLEAGYFDSRHIEYLVLDEADR